MPDPTPNAPGDPAAHAVVAAPSRARPPASSISVVIPAFEEAQRLPATLANLRAYATQSRALREVLVIDDGSRDDTAEVARVASDPQLVVRVLRFPQNRGKGFAARQGMLAAAGDAVLLCDADLSTPIEELDRLWLWQTRGYDVVIGSRDLPESRVAPPQPWRRRLAAWTFRALRRRLLLRELRDTQCGFKLFSARAAKDVFTGATIDGWLFDCEALARAAAAGYRIREVGVTWRDVPGTRVRVVESVPRVLRDLLWIWWRS